jgi:hypothetical protein
MNDAKYIALDDHQATTSAMLLDSAGQVSDGSHSGNQSRDHPAVYPRSARRFINDLWGRNLCGLVVRFAQALPHARVGLRFAEERSVKGRKQNRWHRCAENGVSV